MAIDRFPVELGHVLMFARAVGDENASYDQGAVVDRGPVLAPPTFVQAGAHFDPEYRFRPRPGRPWLGSGREASGVRSGQGAGAPRGDASGLLHAEQHFEYHRPLVVGDVLTAFVRPGATWEKEGKRAGRLRFEETITEYRDEAGMPVVTARRVVVRTERPAGLDG